MNYDRQAVSLALQPYKLQNGSPNYLQLLKVGDRLPEMAKKNFETTLAMIVVAITKALETMNLNRPMNPDQIVELAETILESSSEDLLSLEDVVLFLQRLVRGKYGQFYESIDIPKFMNIFEKYRDERYKALMDFREEQHSQFKSMGDSSRWSDNQDREKEATRSAMVNYLKEHFKDSDNS